MPVETIENTTSQLARSASLSTILAPDFASGSALARVRFQIETSRPAFRSRSAMGKPMRPMPIQPIFCVLPAISSSPPEHDPEKHVLDPDRGWAPVFGSDHAQLSGVGNMGAMALQRRLAAVQGVLAAAQARQPMEPMIRSPARAGHQTSRN